MDKAGVSTNELLDRVAKKRESLKVEPNQPTPKTESSYEEKVADIEKRREQSIEEGRFKYSGEEFNKYFEEVNSQYDAELEALNKEKIENDTVNDTVDVITNSNTYDSNTGDNPPTVDDSNIEINEVNTRDFKRVQAVGLAYRASKFAVKGADAKKITISYEDIDPVALLS